MILFMSYEHLNQMTVLLFLVLIFPLGQRIYGKILQIMHEDAFKRLFSVLIDMIYYLVGDWVWMIEENPLKRAFLMTQIYPGDEYSSPVFTQKMHFLNAFHSFSFVAGSCPGVLLGLVHPRNLLQATFS